MALILSALNVINYAPYIKEAEKANDTAQLENYRTRRSGALNPYPA